VAIATENFLIQYHCHVSMRLSTIVSVRGFVLRPFIPANGVNRRRAGSASRKQTLDREDIERGCASHSR